MPLLDKLTIILPTYNRKPYALRAINYWSGSGVTLHVLDGSPEPIKAKYLENIGTNINYHHMPISILERLKQILGCLNTEYTMLSGDDDFFLLNSVEKCIQEIEVNKELVSCMGRSLAFLSDGFEVKGWPVSTEIKGYSILQDDPIERMNFHMNPYRPTTIYSVIQTNVWKKAMTAVVEKDFQVPGLEELQFELVVSYLGKSKVIDELMWLRSLENPPIRDYQPKAKRVHVWWREKKKHDNFLFLNIMTKNLSNGNPKNVEMVCIGIQRAMDAYTSQFDDEKFLVLIYYSNIYRLLISLFPRKVKDFFKTLLRIKNTEIKEDYMPLMKAAENLKNSGVHVDFEQLKQIVNIVKDFHAGEKLYGN